MKGAYDRRKFIRTSAIAGLGLGIAGGMAPLSGKGAAGGKGAPDKQRESTGKVEEGSVKEKGPIQKGKRVGIIGLDTSHSVEFTKELNAEGAASEFLGYKVVAAYPKGSQDIETSVRRIPGYTEEVKKMGVEIVDDISALLQRSDVVLLETNDGRPHPEQALQVLRAGKTLFIDKPVAASLADVLTIFEAAKHYNIPVFSASSLRYIPGAAEIANGKIGKVLGADAYSPCTLEKSHPDFFWYGIHGVEILYTAMGPGCKELVRVHSADTDLAIGTWADGRIGTFRGTRTGLHLYGGTVFGEKGNTVFGPFGGYKPLLLDIVHFFETGRSPVSNEETLEIYAFMEAADESKRRNGKPVTLDEVWTKAKKEAGAKMKEWTTKHS